MPYDQHRQAGTRAIPSRRPVRARAPGRAVLLLLPVLAVLAAGDVRASPDAEQPRTLRSASELDYPPFALVRPDGAADGFSVELLRAVAHSAGLRIGFKVGPWHAIKQELMDGELDVLPLVSHSTERERYFDFTIPYLRMHGTIFVRADNEDIRTEADLRGREVLVMRGDTAHEYAAHKNLSERLILTETFEEAMRLLASGRHDAVIVQQIVGLQIIRKLGLANLKDVGAPQRDSLKPFGKPLSEFEQKFCIAVRRGDRELLARLNEGLSAVIADGTYDALYAKWFEPILPAPPIDRELLLRYALSVAAPALLLAAAAGVWFLRREVARKTRVLQGEIEERKRTEEQLVQARNQALVASRSKSEFLANMSHEIRTPLNGMLGMLQLLEMSGPTPEQDEYIRAAIRATRRLTRLLSDILDITRIEAGKMQLVDTVFSPEELRESIIELFGPAAGEKGLRLDVDLDPGLPGALLGDEVRVRQVLFNLVGNAIKFTARGGVRVAAMPLPPPGEGRARVLFTVGDSGIGISDEQLRDIFEPFVQAEGTYTKRFQGAGLGLAIVRRLVGLMGGELAIESAPDQGTTAWLSLPFGLPPAAPRAKQARPLPVAEGAPLRVLLAEDDETNLVLGRRMLEKSGYEVLTAGNGQEALELLRERDVDLVILDVQMPVMDGVAATRAIRSSAALGPKALVPIIAMTACAMTGDRERLLAAGMDGYIAKPVDMAAFREVVAQAMAKRPPPAPRPSVA